jgi:gamma-glutamyltranspeptidase/glutathione hydrolase
MTAVESMTTMRIRNKNLISGKYTFLKGIEELSRRSVVRQITVVSCCVLFTASCLNISDENLTSRKGTIGYVPGALGVISVEEPQAALVARDILSAGGTAADAAVAIGLTLSVTMPSSASLAGGGVCIVRDAREEAPKVIDFLPRAPRMIASGTSRPNAIPANPRGLFLLHSKYGELKWELVVSPAENLARFGYNVSRAFATTLAPVASALIQDPVSARVFVRKDGGVISEGDFLKQLNLAATLGRFRSKGVGDFYVGKDAHTFVEAVEAAGGSLTIEDMRDFRPVFRDTISFPWESNTVWHFAGPPAAGGAVAAEMMSILMDDELFEDADPALREHLIAEAAKRAFATRMTSMQADGNYSTDLSAVLSKAAIERAIDSIDVNQATPFRNLVSSPVNWSETPSGVGFSVMDAKGGAVACTLTMNNAFGTGRMAEGYGMILAAAPDQRGRTYTPLGPALLTSELNNKAYMAAASSGGVTAAAALVNVIARAGAGPQNLRDAMRAPRTHYAGVPDKVFVEPDMPKDVIDELRKRGHDVALTKSIGRVTAVYCPTGVPNEKNISCLSAADPRGHGIALGGN